MGMAAILADNFQCQCKLQSTISFANWFGSPGRLGSCSRLAVTPVQMGLRYRTALDQRMPVALDLPADLGRRGGHDDSEGIALPIFGREIVPVSLTVNPNSSGVFRDWKICSGPQSHTTYPHTSRAQPRLPLARRSLFGKVPEIGWRHFNT